MHREKKLPPDDVVISKDGPVLHSLQIQNPPRLQQILALFRLDQNDDPHDGELAEQGAPTTPRPMIFVGRQLRKQGEVEKIFGNALDFVSCSI